MPAIAALRAEKVLLPASAVIERAAIAGRAHARARKRAADALLDAVSAEQIAKLDKLLTVDPAVGMTPYAWLKNIPTSPKADHIRELIDRLRFVRDIGLPSGASTRLHEVRFEQFAREGRRLSDAHQTGRYAAHRREDLQPLLGRRVKAAVVREHWGEVRRLIASLKAGTVAPSSQVQLHRQDTRGFVGGWVPLLFR